MTECLVWSFLGGAFALAGGVMFWKGLVYRTRVIKGPVGQADLFDRRLPLRLPDSRNVDRRGVEDRREYCRAIAEDLHSESAFLLSPSQTDIYQLIIPEGWFYSRRAGFPSNLSLSIKSGVAAKAFAKGSHVFGVGADDDVPSVFAALGIASGIVASVDLWAARGLFVVCNSEQLSGKGTFQVYYTLRDRRMVEAFARFLSLKNLVP